MSKTIKRFYLKPPKKYQKRRKMLEEIVGLRSACVKCGYSYLVEEEHKCKAVQQELKRLAKKNFDIEGAY